MPRKIEWIAFAAAAIRQIENDQAPYVDRRTLQSMLHLSPRRTQQIIQIVGPVQVGTSYMVPREELLRYLKTVAGGELQAEVAQRKVVGSTIDKLRTEHVEESRLRAIPIAAKAGDRYSTLDDVLPNLDFEPGVLRIAHSGAEDLVRTLYRLGQALGLDYQVFVMKVENPQGSIQGSKSA
jgi:hypothetical protein